MGHKIGLELLEKSHHGLGFEGKISPLRSVDGHYRSVVKTRSGSSYSEGKIQK